MRALFILTLYITVHSRSAELTRCHIVQPSVVTVCALWTLCFLPRTPRAVGTNRADVSESAICWWGVVSATYTHIPGITWSSGSIQSWKYCKTSSLVLHLNSNIKLKVILEWIQFKCDMTTLFLQNNIQTRHVFVKHGCPWWQQSQTMEKSQVLHFDPALPPGACDVSEVWVILRWSYRPSLVTVTLNIALYL